MNEERWDVWLRELVKEVAMRKGISKREAITWLTKQLKKAQG